MNPFFSINYVIKDSDQIEKKLQELYAGLPADLLQLNIIDLVDDESSRSACSQAVEACGAHVISASQKGLALGALYNEAVSRSSGQFVNFCDNDIDLTAKNIKKIHSEICEKNFYNIYCFVPYRAADEKHKDFYFNIFNEEKSIGDDFVNLILQSYFFRKDVLHRVRFDEEAAMDYDYDFIIRHLAYEEKYFILNESILVDIMYEFDFYNNPRQYHAEWYSETMNGVYARLIDDHADSVFVQKAVAYLIKLRFACNRNNRNKNILIGEKVIREFLDSCSNVLSRIENFVIMMVKFNERILLPRYMTLVMMKIKNRDEFLYPDIVWDKDSFFAAFDDNILEKSANCHIKILAMNYEGENLSIDAEIINAYIFDFDKVEVYASVGAKKYIFEKNKVYSLDKYFGMTMKRGLTGKIDINVNDFKDKNKLEFILSYKNCRKVLPVRFSDTSSRLYDASGYYWEFGQFLIARPNTRDYLKISRKKFFTHFLAEVNYYRKIITNASSAGRALKSLKYIGYRLLYWGTKPYFKNRKIWLTYDQLFKGGDNGEYFFRHVSENHSKDVDIYYIINKDCEDSRRLKKSYKNVVNFRSLKARLLSMHAAHVFATRVDVKLFLGFSPNIEHYVRGLLNYKVHCLQHGLTIQQIAEYQNRIFDNTHLYFCASKYEIKNLSHPVYGYEPEKLLLTGAPRYDGLVNRDARQILIAPTWRRNVTAGNNTKGKMHEYSVNFKETTYFKIYNSLINDERLIECAKKCGYRLIYLIHPILSPQIGDFDRNDYLEILGGASGEVNYEKMLSESSLMVTDHSGIQYDFAFMKKPLVYYHPDALPAQYEAKTMDYETMGFGPVCKSHEAVVDAVCAYMEAECRIKEEYERRIEDFFEFTDRNNCKRVYEAMMSSISSNGEKA